MTADFTSQNANFWNELCGSVLARSLGITDASAASLARFDRAYLDFYPYLLEYVCPSEVAGQRVVEIGLGYGTLGQQLVEARARYTGIDVAGGPVSMMNHRALLLGRPRCAVRGSALKLPLPDSSVDYLVSIGCFHHTGSVEGCIREAHRVLRRGGVALVMVYNQFSYRHWIRWPIRTAQAFLRQKRSLTGQVTAPVGQRKVYDANAAGAAAPETVFLSVSQLRRLFSSFSRVQFAKQNNSDLFRVIPRRLLLSTLGRHAGLDIYVKAVK